MWILFTAAAILAFPLFLQIHYSKSIDRLKYADLVWGSLEQHAHALMEDKTLDPRVGDFVQSIIEHTGDGHLTRSLLYYIIFRPNKKRNSGLAIGAENLVEGQKYQFARFMVDAVLYDSMRTNISGMILRRVVMYWLMSTAKDVGSEVSKSQISPMIRAAGKAYHPA